MIKTYGRALVLSLPFLLAGVVLAQEPGFTPLFDGAELTGWRYGKEVLHRANETPDKRFTVLEGYIRLNAKDKDGKKDVRELLTVREFSKDFVLKLEFKAAQEAIGSVVIRNAAIPVGDFIRRNDQRQLKKFQTDGWNELEVTVKMAAYAEGRRLTDSDHLEASFTNGKATARVNGRVVDPNRTVIQIEAYPKINGEALTSYPVAVATKGQVGLRSGSGKMEYRNIRFKELP
jgi:hypothetical protein